MTPSRPIEVLYVEDSAGDVLITKQILGDQPVKLTVATDGEQALTMLADERFKPAMIILDLSLPVLSGYDVLERNPRKDIPVVVFSGSSNPAGCTAGTRLVCVRILREADRLRVLPSRHAADDRKVGGAERCRDPF